MNKAKSSKATTKRLVASGIILFGGFLTFVNKPQDVHAEDGVAPIKETNTTAKESSNVAVLKSSVKSTSTSESKVEATEKDAEGAGQETALETRVVSARAAKATETPEAMPSAAPAKTPVPTAGTSTSTDTQVLNKTVTIDGKQYVYTSEANTNHAPLFKNQVTSVSDGTVYTYSGNGGTSSYYMRTAGSEYKPLIGDEKLRTTGKDANSVSKFLPILNENVKIKESISITDDGQFVHTVTVTNTGAEAMTDVSFGLMLDTVLGVDDGIDIFASGTGGAFFKNKYLTVYANGLENTDLYVGQWGSMANVVSRVPATGVYGKNLYHGVDSGIQYETGKINLAPGASYTFKFSERVHIEKQDQGKLIVRYVDTSGKTLRPNKVLENVVGEDYKISPATIEGYIFQSSNIPLTGKYTEADKTLTLVYRDNKLPVTQGQTTQTPKQKTPTSAPVVTTKTNNTLPQTGEKSDITASAIGVGILATLSLFGLARLRKRENN